MNCYVRSTSFNLAKEKLISSKVLIHPFQPSYQSRSGGTSGTSAYGIGAVISHVHAPGWFRTPYGVCISHPYKYSEKKHITTKYSSNHTKVDGLSRLWKTLHLIQSYLTNGSIDSDSTSSSITDPILSTPLGLAFQT